MIVIGLTGGIGMGKSTVSRQFAALGAKICSADACVHALLAPGGAAVKQVEKTFPDAVKNAVVDRNILGKIVFSDPKKRHKLEVILHPMVIAMEEAFVQKQQRLGAKYVVLDIPLLFETGGQERVDITVVASAPAFIQRQRVLARAGMSEEKFRQILASQMPDMEKCERADCIIPTGLGKAYSFKAVKQMIFDLEKGSV